MSERRHDPLSGLDAIIAEGRAARPTTFAASSHDAAGADGCPFCPGHENETPAEVARTGTGEPGTPGWRVRVFPNKFPIVGDGTGVPGAHEVVVLSPDHDRSFAELDDRGVVEVSTMLRDRVRAHLDAGCPYALPTINHLRAAGASIAHPHAQIFGLDFVPDAVERALGRFDDAGADLVPVDAADDGLVVDRRDGVTTWCPPASTARWMFRIAHDDAGPAYDAADDEMIVEVGFALRDALARLARAVGGDVPYNMVVHGAPRDRKPFHWYVEVTPRLSIVAGFEQATGILVNSTPPAQAARDLREASVRA
jgi:UDPglucose--hexose-1-phosphate uridylyltransferase